MKLLDAATVQRGVQIRQTTELAARECGVEILLADFCSNPPDETPVIGTDESLPGTASSAAFAIQGFLRRGQLCVLPDDQSWFSAAFSNELEYALTWALVVEHATGSDAWSGATGTQQTALAGSTDAQIRDAVPIARRQWFKSVVHSDPRGPILHVPPKYAAILKATGVLESEDKTIYGDRVVIGDGYDEHPNIFYSGEITIKLGKLDQETVPVARINDQTMVSDVAASIELVPCAIVRIGAYA